jgi:hypothetical protein
MSFQLFNDSTEAESSSKEAGAIKRRGEPAAEPECEDEPPVKSKVVATKGKPLARWNNNFVIGTIVWLSRLKNEYGARLLILLFASQHLIKGVVQQFQTSSVMWLLREYRIDGPQLQVYVSIANSAWALKPMIGMVSDLMPVFGLRKAPYVIMTSCVGVVCAFIIGVSTKASVSVGVVVLCLFGIQLQTSTIDLLTEATYSEHIQEKPALGPDLISFVWGGITVGNMIAICTVSALIVNFGPRDVFLACIFPCAAIVLPTCLNYFGELSYTRQQLARVRNEFIRQREVLFLSLLMTLLTLLLTFVGACATSMALRFYVGVAVMVTLIPCFNLLLRPEIAQVNTFFMLQAALSMNIGGATFYFYTDDEQQYPEGPHFSPWFYTSTLGFVSSVMSLLGLATYTNYMKNWTYRSLLLFTNCTLTVLSLLDVLMFLRLPRYWGIPDKYFVIGSSVSTVVIKQWQWMPGVVILSQLCPTGMEATIFALLAGCMNLGTQIADYSGAYLLELLGVHPTGSPDESMMFQNLWKASMCATLLPAVTVLLIPTLIPNARQTETLLMNDPSSATAGSPINMWFENTQSVEDGDST